MDKSAEVHASRSFKDVTTLLRLLTGSFRGADLNQLLDLTQLPPRLMEVEKKYRLGRGEKGSFAYLEFLAGLSRFFRRKQMAIVDHLVFSGLDQYFVLQRRREEFVFRYRIGANREPELTVKFKLRQPSNLVRGELTLDVRHESPETIRALMSVVCRLADGYQLFTIGQSGEVWLGQRSDGGLIELVIYQVKRILPEPSAVPEYFVEIEPRNFSQVDQAIRAIDELAVRLKLKGRGCPRSIAELLRPKE